MPKIITTQSSFHAYIKDYKYGSEKYTSLLSAPLYAEWATAKQHCRKTSPRYYTVVSHDNGGKMVGKAVLVISAQL